MSINTTVWSPQLGPQTDAIQSANFCDIVLYGGAKYGGKTDFLLGDYLQDVNLYGQHWQGILVRRSLPELEDAIQRSHEIYPLAGAEWGEQKKTWTFPNGAKLRFRAIEREADIPKYQGHSYGWIGLDELTSYPSDKILRKFAIACNRWGRAKLARKRIRCTANPGGQGHSWVNKMFIEPHPKGFSRWVDPDSKKTMMYIPARIKDNKLGLMRDPGYIDALRGLGSAALVRAWLEGDWNAIEGVFFTLTPGNIVNPFAVPNHWKRYIGMDWGFRDPFSATWLGISSGYDDNGEKIDIPKDSIVVYRNITKTQVENSNQADLVFNASKGEMITRAALDPSTWSTQGSKSIAEQINSRLNELNSEFYFQKAINDRISGWSYLTEKFNRREMLIFSNLTGLIEDLQTIPCDPDNAEDVLTTANDHRADSLRYASMQYFQDSVYSAQQSTISDPLSSGINLAALIKRAKTTKGIRI